MNFCMNVYTNEALTNKTIFDSECNMGGVIISTVPSTVIGIDWEGVSTKETKDVL